VGAGARVGGFVVEQLEGPVGFEAEGLEFVGEERRIHFGLEVAGFLGFGDGAFDGAEPFAHDGGDAVADRAAAAIEFKRGGSEKAAAGEKLGFDVAQPALDETPETWQAFGSFEGGDSDFVDEDLAGGLNGGELEVFLGAEMGEKAAFTHFQVFGQTTDGKAF
jgi:hypothetical protein